jgi:hypothetical protein
MKVKVLSLAALIMTCMVGVSFSQTETQPREEFKAFRLDFVLKEVEGDKIINSRGYSTLISTERKTSTIRAGNRVPIPSSPGSAQFQYIDVGVNIDSEFVKEGPTQLGLYVSAEVSSVIGETPASSVAPASTGVAPVMRQSKWGSSVVVPLKKPTLVFSSDDPTLKRQMQLELTATPVP